MAKVQYTWEKGWQILIWQNFNINLEIKFICQHFGKYMVESKYTWQKFNTHGGKVGNFF